MIPYNIVGRELTVSNAMWNAIHDHIESLEKYFDRIIRVEVAVSAPHRHSQKGKIYHIRVHVSLPGDDVIVSREAEQDGAHEDFYVALRDTFRAVTRKVQDHARKMQGFTKFHNMDNIAHVERIFPGQDFGFLKTVDGREIYFHRNSVINGQFDQLQGGSRVRFTEEMGEKGPQATTVHFLPSATLSSPRTL